MSKYALFGLLISTFLVSCAQQPRAAHSGDFGRQPVHVILDTDIGPDFDDVGAFAVLHTLADKGETEILATVASNRYPKIAEVIDALNTYYNRPDIPIGIPKGASVELKDTRGWVDTIVSNYPHSVTSNSDVPSSVSVYRKVLSQQPDHSVTIITIGFFTNLANLLESGPGKYSKLSGKKLVNKKVKKLVSMAGQFPSGREFNVYNDIPSANYVFENWPTPIIFDGFKIGLKIKTGRPLVNNDNIKDSPIKDVYRICMPKGSESRPSWDPTAVLAAVRGDSSYFKKVPGHINTVNVETKVSWDSTGEGQYYLVLKKPVSYIEGLIDKLIQHQPKEQ